MLTIKKLSIAIAGAVFSAFYVGLDTARASHPVTSFSEPHEHSEPHDEGMQDVLVVPPDTGPSYYASGNLYSLIASGADTGGEFSLFDFSVSPLPPDPVLPPLHLHTRESESFYVKDGELTIFMEDGINLVSPPEIKDWSAIKTVTLGPGSFVYLPKGRIHEFINPGTTQVNTLSLLTPSGFENALTLRPPVTDRNAPIPPFTTEGREQYEANAYQLGLACENCVQRDEVLAQLTGQELQNYLVVPGDAQGRESFLLGGNEYTSLATEEETGGEFSLFNVSLAPQTEHGLLQSNEQQTESYYITDGEVKFLFKNQSLVATPGTFVSFPEGTPYAYQNLGTTPASTLLLRTPAAVPEPSSWLGILGCGAFLGASLVFKRQQKKQKSANL